MQEIEQLIYNFTVQCFGFTKSLNKELPQVDTRELKEKSGTVSIKFLLALKSKENTDFSSNLKKSYESLITSISLLQNINCSSIASLEEEKKTLITKSEILLVKFKVIIGKVIY